MSFFNVNNIAYIKPPKNELVLNLNHQLLSQKINKYKFVVLKYRHMLNFVKI